MKNMNTRTLTRVALLVAIELVMKAVGLGSVPMGPLYMSFLTLPIAVGAITMGPAVGAILGGVFGAVSFYDAITGASAMTGALFQVLASPMFGLDANDLVLLGSRKQDVLDAPCKRPIERGMLDRELYGGHEPSVRLSRAFEVMSRAWSSMGGRPCADVLLDVARESGWLARLEAAGPEGQARAANVLAAVRHVRELCEDLSLGVARAATEFALWLDVAKAAPASLMRPISSSNSANIVWRYTVPLNWSRKWFIRYARSRLSCVLPRR